LGGVSMRFPRSVMDEAQAAARYARPLAQMARAVASDVAGRISR